MPGQSTHVGCPFFVSPNLTPRERETLNLAAQGYSSVEIAGRLWVQPRTVWGHLQNIREKLNARNTAHAVFIAQGLGLIQFDVSQMATGRF